MVVEGAREVGAAAAAATTLIKQLGASDNKTRRGALRTILEEWLPSQSEDISEEEMKKLWKGIFYCVWHADKAQNQAHLIDRLSSLLLHLHHPTLSVHYFSAFLVTMRREWPGIDRLRLDKFYLLIRRFLRSFFLLLEKNTSWDLDFSARMMALLFDKTFLSDDKFQGNGVNYHIATVFLEELRPSLPGRSRDLIWVLLGPFVSVMGKAQDKILLAKIKTNVFDVLLKMGRKLLEVKKRGGEVDSGDDAAVLGPIGLTFGFSEKFYELGSSTDCCQGNRKVLFGLHEDFLKLEKDLAASGVSVSSYGAAKEDGDDEVPMLVPIAFEPEPDGSDNVVNASAATKQSEKRKKSKKASGASGKKTKKKKNDSSGNDAAANDTNGNDAAENDISVVVPNGENSTGANDTNGNFLSLDESMLSNLQMEFEKVAAEMGLDNDVESACDFPKVTSNGAITKKRKRAVAMNRKQSEITGLTAQEDAEDSTTAKSEEKNSAKKVRFSMKNNLVWKPHSPLPPQSLRIPPSVTPRGSALKQGVPPGPVREMPSSTKKAKKRTTRAMKSQRIFLGVPSNCRRVKKIKAVSI